MATSLSPQSEIGAQWQAPGDIFSLLLLVGPDVVQKAIAQLVGVRVKLPWKDGYVSITPVPFSFGWVAYAFASLSAMLGEKGLMPIPDTAVQVINCTNGYVRNNNSWILGRLVRDREDAVMKAQRAAGTLEDSTGNVALLIEIFRAPAVDNGGPRPSVTWWMSWILVVAQHIIAAIPWAIWGYWSPFMITVCGTTLAILTASMPQWINEKWSAARLSGRKSKTLALTRGNGHRYVMIVVLEDDSWDLEAMATGRLNNHPSTKYIVFLVTLLWVLLLLTVTGMKQFTWFIIAVGASGSVWQTYVAAKSFSAEDFNIKLEPWDDRNTITAYQYSPERKDELKTAWKSYTDDDAKGEYRKTVEEPDVRDVMGALIELEKCLPKAGASLLSTFFPGGLDYQPSSLHTVREKKFWSYAENPEKQGRQISQAWCKS